MANIRIKDAHEKDMKSRGKRRSKIISTRHLVDFHRCALNCCVQYDG